MHLTEQPSSPTQGPVANEAPTGLIEITPAMIEAGVDGLRSFNFGQDESQIVEVIYLRMEGRRRHAAAETPATTPSRKVR